MPSLLNNCTKFQIIWFNRGWDITCFMRGIYKKSPCIVRLTQFYAQTYFIWLNFGFRIWSSNIFEVHDPPHSLQNWTLKACRFAWLDKIAKIVKNIKFPKNGKTIFLAGIYMLQKCIIYFHGRPEGSARGALSLAGLGLLLMYVFRSFWVIFYGLFRSKSWEIFPSLEKSLRTPKFTSSC